MRLFLSLSLDPVLKCRFGSSPSLVHSNLSDGLKPSFSLCKRTLREGITVSPSVRIIGVRVQRYQILL